MERERKKNEKKRKAKSVRGKTFLSYRTLVIFLGSLVPVSSTSTLWYWLGELTQRSLSCVFLPSTSFLSGLSHLSSSNVVAPEVVDGGISTSYLVRCWSTRKSG